MWREEREGKGKKMKRSQKEKKGSEGMGRQGN